MAAVTRLSPLGASQGANQDFSGKPTFVPPTQTKFTRLHMGGFSRAWFPDSVFNGKPPAAISTVFNFIPVIGRRGRRGR